MAKLILHVEGVDGHIDLMNDRVVVKRPGVFNMFKYGINSTREIPLSAISEVVFRNANALRQGEIEFVRSGNSTDQRSGKKKADGMVRFKKKSQAEFQDLKEKAFELMAQQKR